MDKEIRCYECRVEQRADGATLISTAPSWNVWSKTMGPPGWQFRERFAPGAFVNLNEDVVVTHEHDNSRLLGRTSSGTAKISSTDKGLEYEVNLPDTTVGRDVKVLSQRGDLQGSSFEFAVLKQTIVDGEDGVRERTVTKANLYQVGPVTNPAYSEGTDVALRSIKEWAAENAEDDVDPPEPEGTPRLDRAKRLLELEDAV